MFYRVRAWRGSRGLERSVQSLAGCVPPLSSFLSSIEAGRGTGGSYLDRWVNTSSSGDRARLSPRRKRTSLGVPKCNLNYFETFFILILTTKVTCFPFSAKYLNPNMGMHTICKLCSSAYVEEMPGNCLLWLVGWKEYRDLGSNLSAVAY